MKHAVFTLTVALLALFAMTGCLSPTGSTVREFDASGTLVKETVTSESIVKTVVESTKDKLVLINDQSWVGGVYFVPPASDTANPAGVVKIAVGKQDLTMFTVPFKAITPSVAVSAIGGLADIMSAARAGEISLSGTGISSSGGTATSAESSKVDE